MALVFRIPCWINLNAVVGEVSTQGSGTIPTSAEKRINMTSPTKNRIQSTDFLKGLVMVLMAPCYPEFVTPDYYFYVQMQMKTSIPEISGQWLGHFKYGPEYGDLHGEQVTFSVVLEDLGNGVFEGKCFELEGIGVNSSVASVKGYIEDDFIHFVKEYPVDHYFEEDGSMVEYKPSVKPILTYDGQYNYSYKIYEGEWELEINLGPTIKGDLLNFCTGTWQMSKCS